MNALQALAWVMEFSLLVAQGPFEAILALAGIGECIKRHTDSMYTLIPLARVTDGLVTMGPNPAWITVANGTVRSAGLADAM